MLLPRRWVVKRRIAWAARFGKLAMDYERHPQAVAWFLVLAFARLMRRQIAEATA